MARGEQQSRQQKPRVDYHQRQVRRNQIIIASFSILLILSMLISLVRW